MSTGTTELLGHEEDSTQETGLVAGQQVTARSPLQLFWRRFRKDKVAMVAAGLRGARVPRGDPGSRDRQGHRRSRPERPEPEPARRLRLAVRAHRPELARRRPARPRRVRPRGLRRAHLARGGVHLDLHHRARGRGDRPDRGLLPRHHRLPAHPRDGRDAGVPRAAAGDRARRRVRRRLHQRRDPARPDRRGDGHRALPVAVHGAHRAWPGAVAAREGVRRGGPLAGRLATRASSSERSSRTWSRRSSFTARS